MQSVAAKFVYITTSLDSCKLMDFCCDFPMRSQVRGRVEALPSMSPNLGERFDVNILLHAERS